MGRLCAVVREPCLCVRTHPGTARGPGDGQNTFPCLTHTVSFAACANRSGGKHNSFPGSSKCVTNGLRGHFDLLIGIAALQKSCLVSLHL